MSEIDLVVDDLAVFEIMQRFRSDGSCESIVRKALVYLATSQRWGHGLASLAQIQTAVNGWFANLPLGDITQAMKDDLVKRVYLTTNSTELWKPMDCAPFSTGILMLWHGGLIPHYEIAKGTIVINQEFKREQYWDGYEYRPLDRMVGWLPLPEVPMSETHKDDSHGDSIR